MKMPQLVPLHVHSDASLRDGLGPVSRLVEAAALKGFPALALTDHGSLANAVSFSLEAQRVGVKPILGLEAYVSYGGSTGHLTLLADGIAGFRNLVRLNNIGHRTTGRSPSITINELIEYSDDIVLLTGCASSPLLLLPLEEALKLGARLKGAFGRRMFVELMFVFESYPMARVLWLADHLELPLVLTNDVHFPYQQDAKLHRILTTMKAGFDYNADHLWLKQTEDIAAVAAGTLPKRVFVEAAKVSAAIARQIEEVDLRRDPKTVLPHMADADAKLELAVFGLCPDHTLSSDYKARAEYELSIIKSMGYSTYFLILHDLIAEAKRLGVRVGPGRGSGAGSLILWLLGVTDIDPIRYKLPFERFLHERRVEMPDVDIDLDSETRGKVLEYANRRWGAVPIATYSRYSHRSLIHDLAKTLRITPADEETLKMKERESAEFEALGGRTELFLECYDAFLDQIRHKGKHAGGVVIAKDMSLIPLERVGGELVAAWTEGKRNELTYAGFVKFDLLGLTALSVLARLESRFGKRAAEPEDAPEVFELFRKGNLAGIFQFSGSEGIRELTMKLGPTKFEDLVVLNGLYRPGALDAGTADKYIEWADSPRKIDPLIDDIVADTRGAIVYQEQVMKIIQRVMGGTLGDAEVARRIVVKSKRDDPEWVAEIRHLQIEFVAEARSKGMDEDVAIDLWMELETHSRYSFNRAHSTAYARIAWETAWWKWHHPAHFYTALLNVDMTSAQEYIVAAVRSGIEVKTPHVNVSGPEYVAEEDVIYVPLTQVNFMGEKGALHLVANRAGIDFTSFEDFMERVAKKFVRGRAREGLLQLGCFSGLSGDTLCLGIKSDVVDITRSEYERQQHYLGYVIPDAELLETIDSFEKKGWVAGVITEVKQKRSRYGAYSVYKLTPHGTFWLREEEPSYKGGQLVAAKKTSTGKASKVKRLAHVRKETK